MTFLEALYGSQYYEIQQKGGDGNKGRLGGNVFLTALIILLLFGVVMVCVYFVPGFEETITKKIRSVFGYSRGSWIGKILAIPLFAVIYFIILKTVGSAENFQRHVQNFLQQPDEIKKKANLKVLIPFFILLVIVFGLAMSKLF